MVSVSTDDGLDVPELTSEILVVLVNPAEDSVFPDSSSADALVLDSVTLVPVSPDDGLVVPKPTRKNLLVPVTSGGVAVVPISTMDVSAAADGPYDGLIVLESTTETLLLSSGLSADSDVPICSSDDTGDADPKTVVLVFVDDDPVVPENTSDVILAPLTADEGAFVLEMTSDVLEVNVSPGVDRVTSERSGDEGFIPTSLK